MAAVWQACRSRRKCPVAILPSEKEPGPGRAVFPCRRHTRLLIALQAKALWQQLAGLLFLKLFCGCHRNGDDQQKNERYRGKANTVEEQRHDCTQTARSEWK
jgi:hypothetical protein